MRTDDSQALKWFRSEGEDPVGVPKVDSVEMDMASMTMEMRSMLHARKGTRYEFSEDPSHTDQWSWRHFLSRIQAPPPAWIEHGIARVACVPIPESYDHNRAANHKGSFGPEVKPPIWDFLVEAGNGEEVFLHPRWGSSKIEIRKHGGQKNLAAVPKKGIGKSDGPGTYKRMTRPVYDERLAAAAETAGTATAPPPQVVPPRWTTGAPAATPTPGPAPSTGGAPGAPQQAATPGAPPPPALPAPPPLKPAKAVTWTLPARKAPSAPPGAFPLPALAPTPVVLQAPSGTQATGGVPVYAIAGKVRADTYSSAGVLNDVEPWFGATPPFFVDGLCFWWHPTGERWFWRPVRGAWYQFPDEYHVASASAVGPGDPDADPIGRAVPGANPSTFIGGLHDIVPIPGGPDQGEATPPAFEINPDGTERIFWWHPLGKQWTWYDTVEREWYGVPRQGPPGSFSI